MADKVFRTYKEQMEILKNRGMIIKSPARFYAAMRQDDYYNVINGYKKYFIATFSPEVYIAGTTFNHIYALYAFDQKIRSLILPELLAIEKNIKSIIAYEFSSVYGYNHTQFLVPNNFKQDPRSVNHTRKTIRNIQNAISYYQSQNNAAIVHYLSNYNYIPLWVINSVLTFGQVVHFYDSLQIQDQIRIANRFNMKAVTLNGMLFAMDDYRNTCAHGARIYTSNTSGGPIHRVPNTDYHKNLSIPTDRGGNYKQGRSDVLALLIMLKTFLSKTKFTKFAKAFLRAEYALAKTLQPAIMHNIDHEMGQPLSYLPTLINL